MRHLTESRWIVCQIGGREHYGLARALHRVNLLDRLVTDAWVNGEGPFTNLAVGISDRLRGRFHPELSTARVEHFTSHLLAFEAFQRTRIRKRGWTEILRRNVWFQSRARDHLEKSCAFWQNHRPIVFAYSYAAKQIFIAARCAGVTTVLGQIDGGEEEERIVRGLITKRRSGGSMVEFPSASYWADWRQECQLADLIVVNSEWSRDLLLRAGVTASKVAVVPVIYDDVRVNKLEAKDYPTSFTSARPLKVLFLGSLIARKGISEALEAAALLQAYPVKFEFVGTDSENIGRSLFGRANVDWLGPVPPHRVDAFYRDADLFLFPSHSDGFGLTQLEAQAWRLPIVASRECARVVEHKYNGLILDEVSGSAIADAILQLLAHPELLQSMSKKSALNLERYSGATVLPLLLSRTTQLKAA